MLIQITRSRKVKTEEKTEAKGNQKAKKKINTLYRYRFSVGLAVYGSALPYVDLLWHSVLRDVP